VYHLQRSIKYQTTAVAVTDAEYPDAVADFVLAAALRSFNFKAFLERHEQGDEELKTLVASYNQLDVSERR
jgi:hypothetical protein